LTQQIESLKAKVEDLHYQIFYGNTHKDREIARLNALSRQASENTSLQGAVDIRRMMNFAGMLVSCTDAELDFV